MASAAALRPRSSRDVDDASLLQLGLDLLPLPVSGRLLPVYFVTARLSWLIFDGYIKPISFKFNTRQYLDFGHTSPDNIRPISQLYAVIIYDTPNLLTKIFTILSTHYRRYLTLDN